MRECGFRTTRRRFTRGTWNRRRRSRWRDEDISFQDIDYGSDHFTYFQFDYDWRRDSVESTRRLDAFIEKKRAYLQREYKERGGGH